MPLTAVAVFGGTFDPVHHGHLRSALELVEHLSVDQIRLMPCCSPPHRGMPAAAAEHRAAMVQLAVAREEKLICDRRELERSGKSYSIDSLIELHEELGAGCSLSLVMGCDAVQSVESWHRWQELLDWAHIVVLARPGWQFPTTGAVARWLSEHRCDDHRVLQRERSGRILVAQLRPLAISSTEIRRLLQDDMSIRYLLPEPVLDYIQLHQLYK